MYMDDDVLCKCGCGQVVKPGNVYIFGHQNIGRRRPLYPDNCYVCGIALDSDNWAPSRMNRKNRICKQCSNRLHREERKKNYQPTSNKECGYYLGVYVVEHILSKVFKNVERMPRNNKGYDFICGYGKRIDVKSSATYDNSGRWSFRIGKNCIADYFLCVAFDNRTDLNPVHIWLMPGYTVNDSDYIIIDKSNISEYDEYVLPIDEVVMQCDIMKDGARNTVHQ